MCQSSSTAKADNNTLFRYYLDCLQLLYMLLGCQLWILRLQGTQRQQRGPIQTQLPDWLDRGRRRDSGDAQRPGEERLFAAWFDQTNTPKAQREIKHLHLQHIF